MNAPAPIFPPNPTIGEVFCGFVWNGNQWICTSSDGQAVVQQVFTTPGGAVYIPSPGLVSAQIECIGGGGGGGGAQGELTGPPITANGWMLSGGGGSSGNYARSTLGAALLRGGVNLVVGAGGAAGPPTAGVTGGAGGETTFGVFVAALGGLGGAENVWNGTAIVGFGGGGARSGGIPITGTGQFLSYGTGGEHGQVIMYDQGVGQVILWGGRGGSSFFQSAEVASLQSPTGGIGGNGFFGAGGGGGASPYVAGPAAGGSGGAGVIIVTEYCLGFGDGGGGCGCGSGQARVAIGSGGLRRFAAEGFDE